MPFASAMAEECNPWLPSTRNQKPAAKKIVSRYFEASESASGNSEETKQNGGNGPRAGKDYSSSFTRGRGCGRGQAFNSRGSFRQQNDASHRGGHRFPRGRDEAPYPTENRMSNPSVGNAEFKEFVQYTRERLNDTGKVGLKKGGNRLFSPSEPFIESLRNEKSRAPEPVDLERLERYSRGDGPDVRNIRVKHHRTLLEKREKLIVNAVKHTASAEVLLTENEGFLEADEGEFTHEITQSQIAAAVDITTATKYFELHLDQFGPYRMNYNRSGRHLLLGGRKGHIAAIDWHTKKLVCEFNVMEETFDVQWLHVETLFAVAQKNTVCIYDNQGIEVHVIRSMDKVLRMEFLPYHFLLVASNEHSRLRWLDISTGRFVATAVTHAGRIDVMTQNPANAVICVGEKKGTVSMWTPSGSKAVAKVLCHLNAITSVAVDPTGHYMATSSLDRSVKIWDLRNLGVHVQEYKLRSTATNISLSQKGLMAISMGNVVEVYRNCLRQTTDGVYMRHSMLSAVANMEFCPFEDVLGAGHARGFTSLIIPGAGEPNFDGLEANPYQSLAQRKETEVKALLGKIQPEFIALDPDNICAIDIVAAKARLKKAQAQLIFKAAEVTMTHRKKNIKGGATRAAKTKKNLLNAARKKFLKKKVRMEAARNAAKGGDSTVKEVSAKVLDRFKNKQKTGEAKPISKAKAGGAKPIRKDRSKRNH